jgi:hypothetical protein
MYLFATHFRQGLDDRPKDPDTAEKFLEKSLLKGNSRAALLIGDMYREDFAERNTAAALRRYMTAMYELSAAMGCPEARDRLAEVQGSGPAAKAGRTSVDAATVLQGKPADKRRLFEIVLSQISGSAKPEYVYADYPYQLYLNGVYIREALTDKKGRIFIPYTPPLKGILEIRSVAITVEFDLEEISASGVGGPCNPLIIGL